MMRPSAPNISTLALLFVCLFLVSSPAWAGNTIRLQADKTRLVMGDLLRLDMVVTIEDESSMGEVTPPAMPGFKVLGSNTSTQHVTQIVNFKMTSQKTLTTTYQLQPRKPGVFVLGPASFKERGRRVSSNRLEVTVVELSAPSGPSAAGEAGLTAPLTPSESESSNLFARFIPERLEVYEGEQVAITLYLYTRVQISRWSPTADPRFPGFSSERLEIGQDNEGRSLILNRMSYTVKALDRHLLTAREAGEQRIPAYQLKVLSGDGFFGGRWTGRAAPPVTLTVKPLPQEGMPPGFSKANVGHFRFAAQLDRRQTEVGQPVTLTVTLDGDANVTRVRMPQPSYPGNIKAYPPTEKTDVYQRGLRMAGRRTAEILLVPQKPGRYRIPPIEFATFDVDQGRYTTLRTRELSFRATPSTQAGPVDGGAGYTPKQQLAVEQDALKPLRPTAQLENVNGRFFGSGAFLVLFWGPLGLVLLVLLVDGLRLVAPLFRDGEKARIEKEIKQLYADLNARSGGDDPAFWSDLRRLVDLQLAFAAGRSLSGLTLDQLQEHLQNSGWESDRALEIVALLERIEMARYAPGGESARREVLEPLDPARAWIGGGRR